MRDVISRYGIEVERNGFAPCPFHSDRHPSMKIYSGDRGFWCYVCNEGGDIFRFIQRMENCGFLEAVSIAADAAGLTAVTDPKRERQMTEARNIRQARKRKQEELHSRFVEITDRIHILNEMARECHEWSDHLCAVLRLREKYNREADRIEERLNKYA